MGCSSTFACDLDHTHAYSVLERYESILTNFSLRVRRTRVLELRPKSEGTSTQIMPVYISATASDAWTISLGQVQRDNDAYIRMNRNADGT